MNTGDMTSIGVADEVISRLSGEHRRQTAWIVGIILPVFVALSGGLAAWIYSQGQTVAVLQSNQIAIMKRTDGMSDLQSRLEVLANRQTQSDREADKASGLVTALSGQVNGLIASTAQLKQAIDDMRGDLKRGRR